MVMGRPREHDREEIADQLVEWASYEDSINLCGFCCTRQPPIAPSKITIWAKEDDHFRKAYETAKAYIGWRREKMLNMDMLHVKAYDLNAETYDHFMKEEKRQKAEYEASLRKEQDAKPTEINVKVSHDGLGRGIKVSAKKLSVTDNRGS